MALNVQTAGRSVWRHTLLHYCNVQQQSNIDILCSYWIGNGYYYVARTRNTRISVTGQGIIEGWTDAFGGGGGGVRK